MVAVACQICRGPAKACDCSQTLTAYLGLLLKVDERVSSGEAASRRWVGPAEATGCIDKLNFTLGEPIDRARVEEAASKIGLCCQAKTLKDRRWYLTIGTDGTMAMLGHPGNSQLRSFVSRPGAFQTWNNYYDQMVTLFGERSQGAALQRLDLAVDYPIGIDSVLRGLDIKQKRSKSTFLEASGRRTGLLVGKSPEKVSIYDKGHQTGFDDPWTRIEVQLTRPALPAWTLGEVADRVINQQFDALKNISTSDIVFVDASTLLNVQRDRLNKLRILLDRDGFYGVRQTLNQSRNFSRDYGCLLRRSPWVLQPSAILRKSLINFFRKEQDCEQS